jgi:hypothetical protein
MLKQISDPPSSKYQAAHKCGNGHLGCVNPKHLSWKTRAENEADKIAHGTISRGERNGHAKLVEASVIAIISRADRGETQQSLADSFGVHQSTISVIVHRKRWRYLEGV